MMLLRKDLLQLAKENNNPHRAVNVDSNLSNGTPVMSSTLDVTHTRDNNDRKALDTRRLIILCIIHNSVCFHIRHRLKLTKNSKIL